MKQPSVCQLCWSNTVVMLSLFPLEWFYNSGKSSYSKPAEFEYLSFCPVLIAAYVSLALYLVPSFVATYTIQKEFNRQSWINGRNLPQQKKHKWHLTSIKAIQVHCAGQSALTCGSCSACWLDFENKYQPIIKKFLYDLSNLTQYVFEYWLKVFGI